MNKMFPTKEDYEKGVQEELEEGNFVNRDRTMTREGYKFLLKCLVDGKDLPLKLQLELLSVFAPTCMYLTTKYKKKKNKETGKFEVSSSYREWELKSGQGLFIVAGIIGDKIFDKKEARYIIGSYLNEIFNEIPQLSPNQIIELATYHSELCVKNKK